MIHIMIELDGCDPQKLDDIGAVTQALASACTVAGLMEVGRMVHQFEPRGLTAVFLVKESHIAIHTWPEHRYAALDLFSCGRREAAFLAVDYLVDAIGGDVRMTEIERGPRTEIQRGPRG